MWGFREFITAAGSVDLGFIGHIPIVTWSNKRSGEGRILQMDDREHATKACCDVFTRTSVLHLEANGADPKALLESSSPRWE